jgi:hypothetical protein
MAPTVLQPDGGGPPALTLADGATDAVGSTRLVVQPTDVARTTSAAIPSDGRPRSITRSAGVVVSHGSD